MNTLHKVLGRACLMKRLAVDPPFFWSANFDSLYKTDHCFGLSVSFGVQASFSEGILGTRKKAMKRLRTHIACLVCINHR